MKQFNKKPSENIVLLENNIQSSFYLMIDLTDTCGLEVRLDEEKGKISTGENVSFEQEFYVTLSQITPILLNKSLRYPEVVYKHHKNFYVKSLGENRPSQSYDLIYIPFGLLGIEYVKTHIYYSAPIEDKYDCVIEVLSGTVTLTIQKNALKQDPFFPGIHVDEVFLVKLSKGDRIAIPTGYFYTFTNTGVAPAVLARVASSCCKEMCYDHIQKQKGLSYFIISKNAKVEVVANPKYKVAHKAKIVSLEKLKKTTSDKFAHPALAPKKNFLFNLFMGNAFKSMLL